MTSITASNEQLVNTTVTGNQETPQIATLAGGGWVVAWTAVGQSQDSYGDGVYLQAYKADGSHLGGEIRVNPTGTVSLPLQQVTALAGGGWVVTWQAYGQDGSNLGVYQQAYKADGSALGGVTLVNTYTKGEQGDPQIAALTGGGWVVTWESFSQDGSGYGIYQQAYKADGSVLGGETRVNTYVSSDQNNQQVTALTGGGWVVTWQSNGQDGSVLGVYQQAYKADGSVLGSETRVNTSTALNQSDQQVTALPGGGWVVVWGQDGAAAVRGIYQQVYKADGSALGSETRVNTNSYYAGTDHVSTQTTTLAGGGWVVTWVAANLTDGNTYDVYQQAYKADGSALGGETRVNTYATDNQDVPQIAALSSGGWVVTWESFNQDGSSFGSNRSSVYQQVYNAGGAAVGAETLVNAYVTDFQGQQQVTALPDGGWVVTWESVGQDGSNGGVYQRVFHLTGAARYDLSGDGKADIVWQNSDGTAVIWFMNGGTVTSSVGLGNNGVAWKIKTAADLNGDGKADLVWQNDDGNAVVWLMNGSTVTATGGLGNNGIAWQVKAAGDFDGDGKADILWQNSDGTAVIYFMNGSAVSSVTGLGNPGAAWKIKSAADFNGDGKTDILWQNSDGTAVIYSMNGGTVASSAGIGNPGSAWHIRDAADFNGDGKADILWQNDDGTTVIWFMNGSTVTSAGGVGNPGSAWTIKSTGDVNGDGKADITWQNNDGTNVIWLMNGAAVTSYAGLGNPGTSWHIVTG